MSSGIPVVPLEGEGGPGNLLLAPCAGRLAGGQRKKRAPPPQLWQEELFVTVNLQEVLSPHPLDDQPTGPAGSPEPLRAIGWDHAALPVTWVSGRLSQCLGPSSDHR